MKNIRIVYAYAKTDDANVGCFGKGDSLPWPHNEQDMQNFFEATKDYALLMGANTFKSLPKKLRGRAHIVLSGDCRGELIRAKSGELPDKIMHGDLATVISELGMDHDKIAVIGGPGVILSAIPYADEIYETLINGEYDHDVTIDLGKRDELLRNNKFYLHSSHCYHYAGAGIDLWVYKKWK